MDYTITKLSQFIIENFGDSYIITGIVTGVFLILYLCSIKAKIAVQQKISIVSLTIGLLLGISISGILNLTLLNRAYNSNGPIWKLTPFWSYYEAVFWGDKSLAIEITENILLFIPLGVMLSLAFYRFQKIKWIILAGVFFSLAIELTQGVFQLGWFEWDDVINNTLGIFIGNRLWYFTRKIRLRLH